MLIIALRAFIGFSEVPATPLLLATRRKATPPETEAREENSGRKKQSQVASKLLTWLEQSSDAIQVSDNTIRHFLTLGENQIDLENLLSAEVSTSKSHNTSKVGSS